MRARRDAGRASGGEISARPILSAVGGGEPARRLVREDVDQGQAGRQARRPARRAQGQCLPRRRADDDRRARFWKAMCRTSTPPSSSASSMPAARSPARRCASITACPAAATPARPARCTIRTSRGYTDRRIVVGQRRAGRRRRRRHGDRRRPGRLDPHPGEPLRHRRAEADLRTCPLHRHRAARDHHRYLRADDRRTCATTRCCWRSSPDPTASTRASAAFRPAATPRRSTAASRECASPSSRKASAIPIPKPDVDAHVRDAAQTLGEVSARPSRTCRSRRTRLGFPVWAAIRGDAACVMLLEMNGAGIGHEGLYVTSLLDYAMAWRDRADEFADTLKIASIFSRYTLGPLWRALLRQGAEPAPARARGLRRRAGVARPAAACRPCR